MRAPKWEGGGEGVRKRKWGGNLFGSIYSLNCLVFISIVEGEGIYAVMRFKNWFAILSLLLFHERIEFIWCIHIYIYIYFV